jgi:hypothetical protein
MIKGLFKGELMIVDATYISELRLLLSATKGRP